MPQAHIMTVVLNEYENMVEDLRIILDELKNEIRELKKNKK